MEVRYPPLKRGISAILARYPMKTRQMGAIPPSAILSRKGIARYGGVSRTGPLRRSVREEYRGETTTPLLHWKWACGGEWYAISLLSMLLKVATQSSAHIPMPPRTQQTFPRSSKIYLHRGEKVGTFGPTRGVLWSQILENDFPGPKSPKRSRKRVISGVAPANQTKERGKTKSS